MITSKLVQKSDFDTDFFKLRSAELKEDFCFHRKLWEHVMIFQTLLERDKLHSGSLGVGFGVGLEPLPAVFASKGCSVIATDGPNPGEWNKLTPYGIQYCDSLTKLNLKGICNDLEFSKLVSFRVMDMNFIPDSDPFIDFLWSSCSLEHLGSIQHSLWFIIRSAILLKKGGIAVHTTEFNLSADKSFEFPGISVFCKRELATLDMVLAQMNCTLIPIDFSRGTHEYDKHVADVHDNPSFVHLNLRLGNCDITSILLIIVKN